MPEPEAELEEAVPEEAVPAEVVVVAVPAWLTLVPTLPLPVPEPE